MYIPTYIHNIHMYVHTYILQLIEFIFIKIYSKKSVLFTAYEINKDNGIYFRLSLK